MKKPLPTNDQHDKCFCTDGWPLKVNYSKNGKNVFDSFWKVCYSLLLLLSIAIGLKLMVTDYRHLF